MTEDELGLIDGQIDADTWMHQKVRKLLREYRVLVEQVKELQFRLAATINDCHCAPAPEKRDPYDIGKGGSRGWEASNYETLVRECSE